MPAGERLVGRGDPEEDRIGDKDPTDPRPDPLPVTLLLRSSRSCLCERQRQMKITEGLNFSQPFSVFEVRNTCVERGQEAGSPTPVAAGLSWP